MIPISLPFLFNQNGPPQFQPHLFAQHHQQQLPPMVPDPKYWVPIQIAPPQPELKQADLIDLVEEEEKIFSQKQTEEILIESDAEDLEELDDHLELEESSEEEVIVGKSSDASASVEDEESDVEVRISPLLGLRRSQRNRKTVNRIQSHNFRLKIHDKRGRRLVGNQYFDYCDCLDKSCPGCHFPCPKCESQKCGLQCRSNRTFAYKSVFENGKLIRKF